MRYCAWTSVIPMLRFNPDFRAWMGDDGFLKIFDVKIPCYPILGEACHCKGKVTNKSIKDGEHLVDLEVSCENQDGLLLVSGNATVRLLSRKEMNT